MYEIINILTGYATVRDGRNIADGSVTLVRGPAGNVLVDTGSPSHEGRDTIVRGLDKHGLSVNDVTHVVGTHGHVDHIGNLNLFPDAAMYVGFDFYHQGEYVDNNLRRGVTYRIAQGLDLMPTPGHTCHDISLCVTETALGVVVVAGDLFECEDDILDSSIWRANSHDPDVQEANRRRVLDTADVIVPGHGPMFKVKPEYRETRVKTPTVQQ